jgi:hypothetical protein
LQLKKDLWLLNNEPEVASVNWIFVAGPSGIGPTAAFEQALRAAGISIEMR